MSYINQRWFNSLNWKKNPFKLKKKTPLSCILSLRHQLHLPKAEVTLKSLHRNQSMMIY